MSSLKKLTVFVLTLVCTVLCAFPAQAADYDNEPYYITSYHVEMNVTEDNILQITEDIDAYFNAPRHGIMRYIPIKNRVEHADGSKAVTTAKITSLKCSEDYSRSTENSQLVLQIGDEDTTVTGPKHYTISYNYALGEDVNDGIDELYFNIIGTGWDTYIQNVSFEINMPKEFNKDMLGFSTGSYGSAGTDDIEYYVNGNNISGSLTRDLQPYEAFTVRLELPDGYFYFNHTAHAIKLALLVLIPVLCFVFVLIIWSKYGRDRDIIKVVEFYPPKGMSSADVAYWNKGMVTNQDLVPLLIELANEGYVAIRDTGDSSKYLAGDYVIERLKTYSGDDENKKIFFDGLFENGRNSVSQSDLEEKFYVHLNKIAANYNTFENRKKVFSNVSLKMRVLCWLSVIITLGIEIFIYTNTFGVNDRYAAFAAGIAVLAASFILSFFVRKRTEKGHDTLQKIKGFKMFLETAEKERLETLVFDNPKYYYDILPYAYVLGVSDVFTEKFEGIAIEPPEWYRGTSAFDRVLMFSFMNSTLRSCQQAMTSAPQTSSSGGGGFAGGGSGGGGGGSW